MVPAVRVERLSYRVGGFTIVDDVSFSVEPGEFVTIIGPNGAGKTTLFNLISGLYRPTGGRIEVLGQEVSAAPPFRRARLGLGRTFQTTSVFVGLSVLENVRLGVQARAGGSLKVWRPAAADRSVLERARGALATVGLSGEKSTAGQLPHSDKRKLELGILLGGGAEVLLLDEPTAGVSVEEVPGMMEVIRTVHREQGKTVLMVEHRMDLVLGLSDRVAVMHQGRLLTIDTPERVMADPVVQQAYLGRAS